MIGGAPPFKEIDMHMRMQVRRRRAQALALAALCALATVAGAQTPMRIVPGPVEVDARGMHASFRIEAHPDGIVSNGSGGACLVYSSGPNGGESCRADSECRLAPAFAGGHAYCLDRQGAADGRGKCWVRPPGGDYCLRSRTPLPLGTAIAVPVDADGRLAPVARPRPGWWRVHACLNGAPGACAQAGSVERMLVDGPVRHVRGSDVEGAR